MEMFVFWNVGGRQRTLTNPTQEQVEHVNFTREGQNQNLNPETMNCDAHLLTIDGSLYCLTTIKKPKQKTNIKHRSHFSECSEALLAVGTFEGLVILAVCGLVQCQLLR